MLCWAPWLFVCTDPLAVAALAVEFSAAGWAVRSGSTGAQVTPVIGCSDHVGPGPAPVAVVVDPVDAERCAEVIDLLVRSSSVVAHVPDRAVAIDLYDQGSRLARAEWYDEHQRPVCDSLDGTQVGLLLALVRGDTVEQASQRCHLSQRTAARRLADARRVLGARTNGEAALALEHRIARRRPGTPDESVPGQPQPG